MDPDFLEKIEKPSWKIIGKFYDFYKKFCRFLQDGFTIFIGKVRIFLLKIVRFSCKNFYKFSGKFGLARSSGGYACGGKNLRKRFFAQTSGETSASGAPFNITRSHNSASPHPINFTLGNRMGNSQKKSKIDCFKILK